MLDRAARERERSSLLLGVRLPSTLDECWLAGCDPESWVRNGWIDYLIVAEHNSTWPGTRVDEFKAFCGGSCPVYAQMGDMMGGTWRGKPVVKGRGLAQTDAFGECYSGMLLTGAEARGAACNYYAWGADGIAFWNVACNMGKQGKWNGPEQRGRMFSWMNAVIGPEQAWAGERRYHYLPLYKGMAALGNRNYFYQEPNRSPFGAFKGQVIEFPRASIGERQVFRFRMADGRNGECVTGTLRFRMFHCAGAEQFSVDLNGMPAEREAIRVSLDPDNADMDAVWFSLGLEQCPPLRGDNELGLTRITSESDDGRVPYTEELDITVS